MYMYVKGLEGAQLSTNGSEITMGLNNRAFINDV